MICKAFSLSISVLFSLLVFLISNDGAHAQINKWVDEHGKVYYGSQPPSNKSTGGEQVEVQLTTIQGFSGSSVKLYTTKWCGYCKKARAYLARNGHSYSEYDIESSLAGKLEFDRFGGGGVPLLVDGNDSLRGFSEIRYNEFFDKSQ